ncbi:MAG TPA: glycolate oxidase subunit GlcF [Steroidobacteraceae bacterium]|nr:glycolate oxidase subunit GlcF [Steroidobacteraceae bacterium]
MQITLADFIRNTTQGAEAEAILRRCVHCGFCTATCPTYQLLGDELDGPRGRIYLIKQMLEGAQPTRSTQLHLDRCLTCLNCETSCPSGVQYGRLVDIGREVAATLVRRTPGTRLWRAFVRELCDGPWFTPALSIARTLRPLLPKPWQQKIPLRRAAGAWPTRRHDRRMLLLAGCVQPSMAPNINSATARVFDTLGIELVVPPDSGCCGGLRRHTDDPAGALAQARRNVDAWWPHLEAGAEAILMNASGCGAIVREYGHLLRNDPVYATKAARVSALTRDLAEVLPALLAPRLPLAAAGSAGRVAFHPPCSLQHAQRIRGVVEALLSACGAEVVPFKDAHLCCGSAGTYSLLQPELAGQLRDLKLAALLEPRPDTILSANVGCITHLSGKSPIRVQHWIEWVDAHFATIPALGSADLPTGRMIEPR